MIISILGIAAGSVMLVVKKHKRSGSDYVSSNDDSVDYDYDDKDDNGCDGYVDDKDYSKDEYDSNHDADEEDNSKDTNDDHDA